MSGINSSINNNNIQNTTTNNLNKTPSPAKDTGIQRNKSIRNGTGPIQFKVRRPSSTSTQENNTNESIKPKTTPAKGLNIFAVSPIGQNSTTPKNITNSNSITEKVSAPTTVHQNNTNINTRSKSPDSRFDVILPSKEELKTMHIDDQLRILALKEMIIVQIKDEISNLNSNLKKNENELHELREIVQKSLYQEISGAASNKTLSRQRTNSNPRDQAIESIKNKRRSSSNGSIPIYEEIKSQQEQQQESQKSKLWSGLSKPFNLLQQFDTLLQNEFERSLTLDSRTNYNAEQQQQQQRQHNSRKSEDSINSIGSITSPLRSKSQTLSEYRNSHDRKSDDMIQTVSSSIWSFVNDVKANVLSSLNEEENYQDFSDIIDDTNEDDEKIDLSIYKN
ncbi:TDA11 [Candida jiufengensis]|uniref:TDA11 n=1 Tax=Candida jiufengensis TaxID=497108 RepID=UPI002224D4E4|nr:TDA11 [Candida jiufengensis]KAI5955099.1 TDA11 [Candida jiufengensis]